MLGFGERKTESRGTTRPAVGRRRELELIVHATASEREKVRAWEVSATTMVLLSVLPRRQYRFDWV